MTYRRFPGWCLLALLAAAGCEEQGTEIVFEVSTGYLVPEQVNAAEIAVVGLGAGMTPDSPDACPFSRSVRMGPGEEIDGSTFTFSVRAGAACNQRVLFKVTLIKDGPAVVASSGTALFVPGRSVHESIVIPRNTTCDAGQQWCDRACADVSADRENCGWCGNTCRPGLSCAGGWCRCPDGKSDCDGACIDTRSDPDNCGGCGRVCSAGNVCVDGGCRSRCEDPLTQCDRACVNVMNDPRHCGSCTNDCGADARCQNGICSSCRPLQGGQCDPIRQCGCSDDMRCDAAQEPFYSPQEVCVPAGPSTAGDYCDTSYRCAPGLGCFRGVGGGMPIPVGEGGAKIESGEPGTCLPWCVIGDAGACDGNPETCRKLSGQAGLDPQYGVCLPFPGLEVCNWIDDDGFNGPDDGMDVSSDWGNCGQCFHVCGAGEACVDGRCQACAPPYQDCGEGWCTDTDWDPTHCGGCGTPCGFDEACVAGSCVPDCGDVLPLCPDSTGTPQCTNIVSDPDHCGYCEAEPCPDGQACVEWGCSGSCPGPGLTICDRTCVNTSTDPRHCSGCGSDCGPGHDCAGGTCESCSPGPARSGGQCYVPTQCGCADGEVCVLRDEGSGYAERCAPLFGEFRELAPGCHTTLADCEPGLQCVPTNPAIHENRCMRLCTEDAECRSGKCLRGVETGPFDPYGVCRAVGGPCTGDWDCPGEYPVCLTALSTRVAVPGGYCTFLCDPSDDQCPVGSRCVEYPFDRFGSACMATCETPDDCREGYNCSNLPGALDQICFPALI